MPIYRDEDITPAVAHEFLQHNTSNRTIRPHKVTDYANMMKNGEWIGDNGVAMAIFDTDQNMFDGQHRMMAIEQSGVTIHGLVVREANPNSWPTVDENIKRMFSDDLARSGLRNSYANASLFRKIMIWDYNGGLAQLGKTSFPRPVMNKAWPQHAEGVAETVTACNKWTSRWPGNKGALHFMDWLLAQRNHNNPEVVNRFFSILTDGSQDEDDKILINVREALSGRVSKYRTERNQVGVAYQVFYMHRGWNGWLRGDKLSRLALPKGGLTDPYPKLLRAVR